MAKRFVTDGVNSTPGVRVFRMAKGTVELFLDLDRAIEGGEPLEV
jgi:hypothetical protein